MKEALTETVPVIPAAPTSIRRYLVPSLSDALFCTLLYWWFIGNSGFKALIADGDTGWHIRTGQWILTHGRVPMTDMFSFTKAGQPWFAWEWLSDVAMALLYDALGLKGVVLAAAVVLMLAVTIVFRHMLWRGGNLFISGVVTLLVCGGASVHFLARPHVLTMLLLAVSMWILERDRREPNGWTWVWILVPMAAVWTNLHGAFLVLPVCVGAVAVGTALEGLLSGLHWKDLTRARRYFILSGACALATLANPYGWNVHLHIAQYVRAKWILDLISEFQSPSFRDETLLQHAVVMFVALGLCGLLLARRRFADTLLIVFWAWESLISVRHVPIFLIVSSPIVVEMLTGYWRQFSDHRSKKSLIGILRDVSNDFTRGPMSTSIWGPVLVVSLILIGGDIWPKDFPAIAFPTEMVAKHEGELAPAAGAPPRILTSDVWAGYLIFKCYPRVRVFFDGRSDFYGEALGKDYLALARAGFRWEALLDRYRFDMALLPPDWPLVELLKRDSRWTLIADDGKALLFRRIAPPLMKQQDSAESVNQSLATIGQRVAAAQAIAREQL